MKTTHTWLVPCAFAAIYLIWGSTYLGILIALKTIPPFLLAALRFVLAGVLLVGWCVLRGERASWLDIRQNSWPGILMLFGGTGAVVWAEQYIPSGLAAIIVASLPFWFVLLDRRQWTYHLSNKMILAGVAVGFLGILLLFGKDQATSEDSTMAYWAMGALIAGGLAWASGSLYLKYHPTTLSTQMNAGIQSLAAGVFGLIVSALAGEPRHFSFADVSVESSLAMAYLVVMGSLVAYSAYIWLLKTRSAVQVGTYAYVNPVVALLLGGLFAGEAFAPLQIGALVIILIGVLLINAPKYKVSKAEVSSGF